MDMKCNHCEKVLDFAVMKRKNFLETGKTHLTVWLVLQNTPEIKYRGGIKVRTGSFDLLGVYTEPERAHEVKDMQDSYWEDRCLKSERPRTHVEEVQMNHHWAWCMFQEMIEPRNTDEDKISLRNIQDWETIIGDVDLSVLDNKTVKKLLLKYASTRETFYLRDFVAEMDVPTEVARYCIEELINTNTLKYYEMKNE